MDFIEGLPKSEGINTIMVVVDWKNKNVHLWEYSTLLLPKQWPGSLFKV